MAVTVALQLPLRSRSQPRRSRALQIDNTVKYQEWLEFHWWQGLGNVSYRASQVTNGTVVMVGPPRVRQQRAQQMCEVQEEMAHTHHTHNYTYNRQTTCYDDTTSEEGGWASLNNISWSYQTAAQTEEASYNVPAKGLFGRFYNGDGYVLDSAVISELLQRPPTKVSEGTEFYRFAHSRLDLSDVEVRALEPAKGGAAASTAVPISQHAEPLCVVAEERLAEPIDFDRVPRFHVVLCRGRGVRGGPAGGEHRAV